MFYCSILPMVFHFHWFECDPKIHIFNFQNKINNSYFCISPASSVKSNSCPLLVSEPSSDLLRPTIEQCVAVTENNNKFPWLQYVMNSFIVS